MRVLLFRKSLQKWLSRKHLGSHNQFHVKLIREIDDFVECLARAFDFLWFIDFITTSKCKVLRTELLSAWFSEFFEKR